MAEVKKPKQEQMTVEAEQLVVKTDHLTVKSDDVTDDTTAVESEPVADVRSSVKPVQRPVEEEKPLVLQELVDQPTAMPTNKWLFWAGGLMLGMVVEAGVTHFQPDLLPEQFWRLFPMFLGGVAAYYVKDQRNA